MVRRVADQMDQGHLDLFQNPTEGAEDGFVDPGPRQLLHEAVDPWNLRSYALEKGDLGLLAAGEFFGHDIWVRSSPNLTH